MFRHRSATPAGDTGNGIVRSLGDNVASIPQIGRQRVSQAGDCQHHGGREPAVRDRVNLREVPIKAVINDKPKMLSGLNQNGMWSGTGALLSPIADDAPPADRHDLNPERSRRETN